MTQVFVCDRKFTSGLEPMDDVVLISISTPNIEYKDKINLEGWADSLALEFHDVMEPRMLNDDIPAIHFTQQHAVQTFNFIQLNLGKDFIVHCDAGISRSMAIGVFLYDFYTYDLNLDNAGMETSGYKNILMYNLLRRIELGIPEDA